MPMFVDTSPPANGSSPAWWRRDPAATVSEDRLTIAFADIGQVNPGHVLVATKRHAATPARHHPEEAAAVSKPRSERAQAVHRAF